MAGRITGPRGEALIALLRRLPHYKVTDWTTSDCDDGRAVGRHRAPIDEADVVASTHGGRINPHHALLLDIDHPAWLVRSTTEGHFHLYVDIPGGIPHSAYMALLDALADAGVVERGYADASRVRGFSSLRLPWVKKEKTDG